MPPPTVPGPPVCDALRVSASFQVLVQSLGENSVEGDRAAIAAGLLVSAGKIDERLARCF
jgi:hypothetical protein